ncbi:hypothetical protein CONPUDRAFT_168057 [Coniophora puteana RWD-64-598 SS2]|uniref:Rhodopsin domain-containing protein n=1 Tax=Coniophora puteana (strain RWD-64-598) TaxID=741705 RepID=A0A5M3MEJ4_CONPW|nr:uncharacterized protein CONPUDRAFT_168057 [Coniophora puteana RWD-64-598 SS2]EIW77025.1 hypothetical protein CONPUDRAFT_168057 [Coniophora puteana RWD-64-598 SS2]
MFMTWLASCMWNNVVWWSRMSILCSFIRITHTKSPQRRAAYVSAVFFVLMWLALFARQMYLCKYRHCIADQTASLMQIITGVFADIPLIVLPVWLLRGSSLPRNRRMLVYAVFFSSMVITVLVIFHGVYDMGPFNEMVVLGAHVLAALSLIICNLFVIVTCIVRLIYCGDGSEADNSQLLTTVLEAALAVETSAPHVLDLRFSGATPELSGGPDDIAGKNLDDCKSTVEQK